MLTLLVTNEAHVIAFLITDEDDVAVSGLGTTFVVSVSKDGGEFITGTGTKAEIGSGWYTYELTETETDTAGTLEVRITGTGAVQQTLQYEVSESGIDPEKNVYILTVEEAANVLRCEDDDAELLALLPLVDDYIRSATGRDWAEDNPIRNEAKSAARMLLVQWHEDPGGVNMSGALSLGLRACLLQLKAIARLYKVFEGGFGAGGVALPGAIEGDTVASVTGKVGASGDQSASFEAVITVDDQIQQVSTDDLTDTWFIVKLTPVSEL